MQICNQDHFFINEYMNSFPFPAKSIHLVPIHTCVRHCTSEHKPVCGSNGVTYGNKCTFQNAKCTKRTIRLRHAGKCKTIKPKGDNAIM